jgi:hypothetical protein
MVSPSPSPTLSAGNTGIIDLLQGIAAVLYILFLLLQVTKWAVKKWRPRVPRMPEATRRLVLGVAVVILGAVLGVISLQDLSFRAKLVVAIGFCLVAAIGLLSLVLDWKASHHPSIASPPAKELDRDAASEGLAPAPSRVPLSQVTDEELARRCTEYGVFFINDVHRVANRRDDLERQRFNPFFRKAQREAWRKRLLREPLKNYQTYVAVHVQELVQELQRRGLSSPGLERIYMNPRTVTELAQLGQHLLMVRERAPSEAAATAAAAQGPSPTEEQRKASKLARQFIKGTTAETTAAILAGLTEAEIHKATQASTHNLTTDQLAHMDQVFISAYHQASHRNVIEQVEMLRQLGLSDPRLDELYRNPHTIEQIREVVQRLQSLADDLPEELPNATG